MTTRYLRGLADTNILIYLPSTPCRSTANPADFQGLESVVAVVRVPVPPTGA